MFVRFTPSLLCVAITNYLKPFLIDANFANLTELCFITFTCAHCNASRKTETTLASPKHVQRQPNPTHTAFLKLSIRSRRLQGVSLQMKRRAVAECLKELKELKELVDAGTLNHDEFENLKQRLPNGD